MFSSTTVHLHVKQEDSSKRSSRKYEAKNDPQNENIILHTDRQQQSRRNLSNAKCSRSALKASSSGGSMNSSSQTSSSSSSDSSVILSRYPFSAPLLPSTLIENERTEGRKEKAKESVKKNCIKYSKIVVAEYDFNPLNPRTDLPLSRSQEYEVITENIEGCSGWWIVKNKKGETGFIPANYVKEKVESSKRQPNMTCSSTSSSSSSMSSSPVKVLRDAPAVAVCKNYRPEWFVPELDRFTAERILKSDGRVGSFVVRYSVSQCSFTISLLTKRQSHSSTTTVTCQGEEVKHYLIRETSDPLSFYLSENQRFNTLEELINYHRAQSGSLVTRLKHIPSLTSIKLDKSNSISQMYADKSWEIRASDLTLMEELGSGQFGVVRRGKWTRLIVDSKSSQHKQVTLEIAVKLMKEGTMSEEDFIREARVMTKLRHPNLVQLYGLCIEHRPICIVTEFMKHGSLLSFLRSHGGQLKQNTAQLLEMCLQVCDGMAYLEDKNYIHRDLAARNCLVGVGNKVKVADFGLARFVADSNEYTSTTCTKFPIRWAPPEVLWFSKFSSKSDIWAFGVLMWEVFTCGSMPYGKITNAQVVDMIRAGKRLQIPKLCTLEIYNLMSECWQELPENRPHFSQLYKLLNHLNSNTHSRSN